MTGTLWATIHPSIHPLFPSFIPGRHGLLPVPPLPPPPVLPNTANCRSSDLSATSTSPLDDRPQRGGTNRCSDVQCTRSASASLSCSLFQFADHTTHTNPFPFCLCIDRVHFLLLLLPRRRRFYCDEHSRGTGLAQEPGGKVSLHRSGLRQASSRDLWILHRRLGWISPDTGSEGAAQQCFLVW